MNAQSPIAGRPISGPPYASHGRLITLPDGYQTTTCPRLQIAAQLYAAALHGCGSLIDSAPGRLAEQAVQHADRLIRANDQFRPAPTPPTTTPAPSLTLAAVRLLARVCQNGRLEPWEQRDCPPAMRELLKAGVAAYSTPLGDLIPTPDGIALMRGDAWTDPKTTSPPPTSTPSTTASTPSAA